MISPLAVILGATIGPVVASYVTTAVLRSTDEAAPAGARSSCDGCGRQLTWLESAPIASYLFLRGRCGACGSRISFFHPIGEVTGLIAGLAIALAAPDVRAVVMGALAAALLATSLTDIRTRRLPNWLSLTIASLGALLAACRGLEVLLEGAVSAVLSLILLGGLAVAYHRRRGAVGIGQGDVKLFAALAVWVGAAAPWLVFSSAGLALVLSAFKRPADRTVVMGPPIALAGFVIGVLLEGGAWPGV